VFQNERLDAVAQQHPETAETIGALLGYQKVYNHRIGLLVAYIASYRISPEPGIQMVRQYGEAIHTIPLRRLASFPCIPEKRQRDNAAERRIGYLRTFASVLQNGPLPPRPQILRLLSISFSKLQVHFSTEKELVVNAYDYALSH
jgi:hypothetical protein